MAVTTPSYIYDPVTKAVYDASNASTEIISRSTPTTTVSKYDRNRLAWEKATGTTSLGAGEISTGGTSYVPGVTTQQGAALPGTAITTAPGGQTYATRDGITYNLQTGKQETGLNLQTPAPLSATEKARINSLPGGINPQAPNLITPAPVTGSERYGISRPISTPPAPEPPTSAVASPEASKPLGELLNIQRNLMPGMTGDDVKALQNYLIQQGYSIPAGATGYYGPQTKAAVTAFQQKVGIQPKSTADYGYFGPISRGFTAGGSPTGTTGGQTTSGGTTSGVGTTRGGVTGGSAGTATAEPTSSLTPTQEEFKGFLQQVDYSQMVKDFSDKLGLNSLQQNITATTKQLQALQDKKTDEISGINNNPWISEGIRVVRVRKLDEKYEQKEANLRDAIKTAQDQYQSGVQQAQFAAKIAIEQANDNRDYDLKVREYVNSLNKPKTQIASIQEYEYAKSQGYKGSFSDYQNEDANRKRSIAAAGAGGLTPGQINTTVSSIAGSFDNEPIVKNYNTAQEGYQTIKSIGVNTKSPADDIAFIYAFAKIMDPNSVVREGEYNTVQRYAQTWASNFGFTATRVFSNTNFLTADAKQKMLNALAPKVNTLTSQYNNLRTEYQRQINDAYAGSPRQLTQYTPPNYSTIAPLPQDTPPTKSFLQNISNWLFGS